MVRWFKRVIDYFINEKIMNIPNSIKRIEAYDIKLIDIESKILEDKKKGLNK